MAQNTYLDVAARGHADWNLINGFVGHFQEEHTPGFTGVTPEDRVVAAGNYDNRGTFAVQENSTMRFHTAVKTGYGELSIRKLLNAPYHASSLVDGWRDVGISVRNTNDVTTTVSPRITTNIKIGHRAPDGAQLVGSDEVLTYPCDGSTGIEPMLTHEEPNPVPGRDLRALPLGSSIQVMVRAGQVLAITSAQMINVATGAPVTLRTPETAANSPHMGVLGSHQGFVSADAPLEPRTQYQVTVRGTNNGAVFSRTFNFRTGTYGG